MLLSYCLNLEDSQLVRLGLGYCGPPNLCLGAFCSRNNLEILDGLFAQPISLGVSPLKGAEWWRCFSTDHQGYTLDGSFHVYLRREWASYMQEPIWGYPQIRFCFSALLLFWGTAPPTARNLFGGTPIIMLIVDSSDFELNCCSCLELP